MQVEYNQGIELAYRNLLTNDMKRIAVLLTTYNRKDKTINCLNSLSKAIIKSDFDIIFDIYLVDDNSSDGTTEAVNINFPQVTIVKGSGNLYWSRGMRLAWETAFASKIEYDSFLLLNDDVVLSENVIMQLMGTHYYSLKNNKQSGIYVCSTMDPVNSKISYGGLLIKSKGIRIKKIRISPINIPQSCSMANANILMVTKSVVNSIGIFDPRYIQRFADYDYTLSASEKGIPVLVCPGIGGYCTDDHGNGWLPNGSSLRERIKYLYSPKGLGYKENLYNLKKNFKYQFPYYFIMLWLKTLFPFFWDKFKKDPD